MLIEPVDDYGNLFFVRDVVPAELVQKIVCTDWLTKTWQRQSGQEQWSRRKIDRDALPWFDHWQQCIDDLWPVLEDLLKYPLSQWKETAWWVDEPGFVCDIHTDGEMPGAMQLCWLGNTDLGTVFYHDKSGQQVRYHFPFESNAGYLMCNRADNTGYRHLQWHGMLTPVPEQTYRLTSYTWIFPKT